MGVFARSTSSYTDPLSFPVRAAEVRAADTRDELYFALRALERLDEVADASFPPPCTQTPALNGFFMRDDVPAEFHRNFRRSPLCARTSSIPRITNKEMSQDQVYHVLIGLALTKRLFLTAPARTASSSRLRSRAG